MTAKKTAKKRVVKPRKSKKAIRIILRFELSRESGFDTLPAIKSSLPVNDAIAVVCRELLSMPLAGLTIRSGARLKYDLVD